MISRVVALKFGSLCSLLFIFFSLLGRVLFPFGDEPDFTVRAPRVLNNEHPFWSPYYMFSDLISYLNISPKCEINSSPLSLVSSIDLSSCSESYGQILIRWVLTICIVFVLFILTTFLWKSSNKKSLNQLIHVKTTMSLTLLFPGCIYYLGVLAEEQFALVLSLLIYYFWKKRVIVLILISMIAYVDFGNSIVVVFFVFSSWFYVILLSFFREKTVYCLMFIQVIFAYILGYSILEYASYIDIISGKSSAMLSSIEGGGFADKYPVLLRPAITFMSMIFFTPAYIKAPALYLAVAGGLLFGFIKYFQKNSGYRASQSGEKVVLLVNGVALILSLVFMFPTYGNAKYYVFLVPFFISFFLLVFERKRLLLFFSASNILLYLHLIVYRL